MAGDIAGAEGDKMTERPFRNLGLDLVRATEAGALAAGHWMGLDKPEEADRAATEAMCEVLNTIEMRGRVVLSEESRYQSCGLRTGGSMGTGRGPEMDIVLDPIDGRSLLAHGHPGAISAIAAGPSGALWAPSPAVYMEKLIVNATVAAKLVPECLDAPAAWTLALIARAGGKTIGNLVVFCLDRPRHADLIQEIRSAGARVMLRAEGDIAGALLAVSGEGGVDVLMGVGGIIEGLITACAVQAARGAMLGRLAPQSQAEYDAILATGLDLERILTVDELVTNNEVFVAATGITDGPLLSGVRYHDNTAASNSMILRGRTHTRRIIQAEHQLDDLE